MAASAAHRRSHAAEGDRILHVGVIYKRTYTLHPLDRAFPADPPLQPCVLLFSNRIEGRRAGGSQHGGCIRRAVLSLNGWEGSFGASLIDPAEVCL